MRLLLCSVTCAFAVMLAWSSPAHAFWRGTVDDVRDCGFILARNQGGPPQKPVSLHGILCPDPRNPASVRASARTREALTTLLPKGLTVTVHAMKRDLLGRFTGSFITLPDGRIVQEEHELHLRLRVGFPPASPRSASEQFPSASPSSGIPHLPLQNLKSVLRSQAQELTSR